MFGNHISKEALEQLREEYPKGTIVKLLSMDDPYAKIPEGTLGTVNFVDDMGTVHVSWKTGSSLGLVYGEDSYVKVKDSWN